MTDQGFFKRLLTGATARELASEPVALTPETYPLVPQAPAPKPVSTIGQTVNNLAKARDAFHIRAAALEHEIAVRTEELRQCTVSAKAVTLALSELSDDDALTDDERQRSGF